MRLLNLILICTLLMLGCGPEKDREQMPDRYIQQEKDENNVTVTEKDTSINIGDVEHTVYLSGIVSTELASDTIQVNTIETKKKRASLTTVDLYPPYPETLPIQITIFSDKEYAENPVVVRGKVYREEQVIGDFAAIMVSKSGRSKAAIKPTFDFDALKDLEVIPETMSIHARAVMILSKTGTKEESIDPLSFDVDDLMRKTVVLSSPIRVNFHKEAR